ncbi:probable cytochrome P450 4d14 [Malaya genurostris]|uniref:probable cytochrome P450 4d14 n=1 Tax=Malaya genurostris TaxID=325434 RepID=UPI0026F3D51D|nr:probable cytochrome P450 4d14 [Malaya genurostris]
MFYFAIFFTLLTVLVVRFINERRKLWKFARHFPGPKPFSLLGNLLEFQTDIPGIFKRMVESHTENGPDIVTWGLGNDIMLNLSSVQSVEKVLMAKVTQKSVIYDYIEPWLGKGLLISSGEKWFHRRKIITPTFHFKILEGFAEIFNKEADLLMQKLKRHDGAEQFDIYDYVSLYALDSICETSMGVQINAQQDPTNQYVCDVKRMSELILLRVFSPLSTFTNIYWYLVPNAWEQRKLINRLHQFTDSVIHQRREQLKNNKQLGSIKFDLDEADMYSKRKQTFLDLLLNVTVDGKPLSNLDIREEVDTFMFEGHDTTTSGISFTVLQLAKHQDIQQKVYDEIQSTLGKDDCKTATLTYNNLQDFKYLDMVIKESLRLLPPVSFIGRKLVEDTEINGVVVPSGVDVTIPIYVIHRNPKVYPDPERFDPERFAKNAENQRGPYDYIPFSVGSRNCIGQRYALMELKVTIIKLLANYRVLPGETIANIRFKTDLVLRPAEGIPIKIVSRNS